MKHDPKNAKAIMAIMREIYDSKEDMLFDCWWITANLHLRYYISIEDFEMMSTRMNEEYRAMFDKIIKMLDENKDETQ